MNYVEYKITFPAPLGEEEMGIYIAGLEDMGFESFTEEERVLAGYLPLPEFVKNREEIDHYLALHKGEFSNVEVSEIEQRNWNALWESNFTPTIVNDRCAVIAPFHERTGAEYELVIMPKMSFGTGHHETTRLMMEDIFELDLAGKAGLDMGCGTGVLAILAARRGASHVDAVDIDEWAYDNAQENVETNGVAERVTVKIGDASLLAGMKYRFILANINRNILLEDMDKYVAVLEPGGTLSISGFLAEDVEVLKACAASLGLTHEKTASHQRWHMMRFRK